MTHPVPDKALENHIAILGKTGSGKTTAAKGIVERLLDSGQRVCAVDPTGAWHGLRSSSDGKRAGYPVVIFGGAHADLPLGGAHGEAIAEVIGTSSTPAIIDTSAMKVGERTRFFTDFAEGLQRKNRGPLHLVIDEAHLFMPQGRVADPLSGQMLHAANNMVSLGRSRGLRIIMITQRPAKLHKDSLTQAETLIALRLIAPQDRAAVEAWIEDNADDAKAREIITSLATLKTGQGWIWAPELDVLERVQFPRIRTFDSGRAPDGSEPAAKVLAPIDREMIAARLEEVSAAAVADDPKRLRARIGELERQLKASGKPAPTVDAVKAAWSEGYESGHAAGSQAAREAAAGHLKGLRAEIHHAIEGVLAGSVPIPTHAPGVTVKAKIIERFSAPQRAAAPARSTSPAQPKGDLTGPEQRILDAIMWLESTTGAPEHEQTAVAFLAEYTFGGGAFNNPRGKLHGKGLVEYCGSERIKLTDAGRALATIPAEALTAEEMHRRVLGRLPGPMQKILQPLLQAYPDAMNGDEVARAADYAPDGGAFNNPRGRLRSLGLIEYVGSSQRLRASDALFPSQA